MNIAFQHVMKSVTSTITGRRWDEKPPPTSVMPLQQNRTQRAPAYLLLPIWVTVPGSLNLEHNATVKQLPQNGGTKLSAFNRRRCIQMHAHLTLYVNFPGASCAPNDVHPSVHSPPENPATLANCLTQYSSSCNNSSQSNHFQVPDHFLPKEYPS
jgi:hypothetical protein